MKKFLLLLCLCLSPVFAQHGQPYALPGPVEVLPEPDLSSPNPFSLVDATWNHSVGLISPATVYQLQVVSATAANPMVLTLDLDAPPTIYMGGTITLSGAAGAGCSGMNATHAVSAVSGTSVTITFNGTGCTYTGSSASALTSIWFQLPDRDGSSGKCWGWSSAYVLDWVTCSGGGSGAPFPDNTPLISNFTDPTKLGRFSLAGLTTGTTRVWTMQDGNYIVAGTNFANTFTSDQTLDNIDVHMANTVNLGTDSLTDRISNLFVYESYHQYVQVLDPTPFTGQHYTTGINNGMMVTTNKLNNPVTEWTPTREFLAWGTFGMTNDPSCTLGGTCYWTGFKAPPLSSTTVYEMPAGDGTAGYVLATDGAGTLSWVANGAGAGLPVSDVTAITYLSTDMTALFRISNSLISTGATRIGTVPNANFTFAGSDISQTWTNAQTYSANILWGTDSTYNFGSNATRAANAYVDTGHFESLLLDNSAHSSAWNLEGTTAANTLRLRNTSGTIVQSWNCLGIPCGSILSADLLPNADNFYQLGDTSLRWLKVFTMNLRDSALGGFGTRCVQTDNNGDLSVAAIGCSSFTNPLAVTGDIIYSSSGSTAARLGIGSPGQYLTVSGGIPAWTTISGTSPISFSGGSITCTDCMTLSTTQTVSGSKTFSSSILASGTVNIGSTTTPFTDGDFKSLKLSRASGVFGEITYGLDLFTFKDEGANTVLQINSLGFNQGLLIKGGAYPTANNTYDLGNSTNAFATLYLKTALGGTGNSFNLTGNMTVTGNFYNRSFSGSAGVSCAGVADGWTGFDFTNQYLIMCAGGNRYRVNLVSF